MEGKMRFLIHIMQRNSTGMRSEDPVGLAQDREQWRVRTAHLLEEDGL